MQYCREKLLLFCLSLSNGTSLYICFEVQEMSTDGPRFNGLLL